MSKKFAKREMVSAAEGMSWEPETIGDVFCGRIIGRRMVDTAYGFKPVVTIVNEETGEVIDQFCSNLATRRLALIPNDTYVELTYNGEEEVRIGRKKQVIKNISAKFERVAPELMLSEAWMVEAMRAAGKETKAKPKKATSKKS